MPDALRQVPVTPTVFTGTSGAMVVMPMVPMSMSVFVFVPGSLSSLLLTIATPSQGLEQLMGEFVNGFFNIPGLSS